MARTDMLSLVQCRFLIYERRIDQAGERVQRVEGCRPKTGRDFF